MRRIIPLLIIVSGSVLILTGGSITLYNQAVRNPGIASLPSQVANQRMTIRSKGWQAIDEFNRLHRQEFPLVAGAVGTYGGNHNAKLWVAEALFDFMAGKMVTDMRDKIAEGNSPFIPTGERQQPERTIYELDGMGQKHFYFQSGKLIIWLAADKEIADQVLEDTLEFYP